MLAFFEGVQLISLILKSLQSKLQRLQQ